MVPSGLLPGACQTSLISLLLVCCLLLPGELGRAGVGELVEDGDLEKAKLPRPCCPGCRNISLNSFDGGR